MRSVQWPVGAKISKFLCSKYTVSVVTRNHTKGGKNNGGQMVSKGDWVQETIADNPYSPDQPSSYVLQ